MFSKPSWLFKPIVVDDLAKIQQEFLAIKQQHYSDLEDIWKPDLLVHIDKQYITALAPNYIAWLTKLGIVDRWAASVWAANCKGYNDYIPHVDKIDFRDRCFAINIPIANCENSYTVWYDVEPNSQVVGLIPHYKDVPAWPKDKIKGELGRMPAAQTAIINVAIPHCSQTDHNDLRLVLTTRFTPEIFDVVESIAC